MKNKSNQTYYSTDHKNFKQYRNSLYINDIKGKSSQYLNYSGVELKIPRYFSFTLRFLKIFSRSFGVVLRTCSGETLTWASPTWTGYTWSGLLGLLNHGSSSSYNTTTITLTWGKV